MWKVEKLNSMFWNYECGTHSKFNLFEFSLSVFDRNMINHIKIFFSIQNRISEFSISILIVQE